MIFMQSSGTTSFQLVWVANRDKLNADSNRFFTLQDDGNLAVLDGAKNLLWKTSVSTNATSLVAVLMDSGNLVLRNGKTTVWQSFDNPFDTLLPGMKIGVLNPKSGSKRLLTSRKKADDLGLRRLSFGVDPRRPNQLIIIIWDDSKTTWESGVWSGSYFEKIPKVDKDFLFYFTKNNGGGEEVYFMYSSPYNYTRLVMDVSGQLQFWIWYEPDWQRRLGWSTWADRCEYSDKCGPNSICKSKNSPVCSCLPGFEPVSTSNWTTGNWLGGCQRKGGLQCGKEDKFWWQLSSIYMLDISDQSAYGMQRINGTSIEDCKSRCLDNCNCSAYACPR